MIPGLVTLVAFIAGFSSTMLSPRRTLEPPRVGPSAGSLLLVGGGSQGPDVFQTFISLSGGVDALIVDIPSASEDPLIGGQSRGSRMLQAAGARNVVVIHASTRDIANSDSIASLISRAGGVWFGGGRQGRLVDAFKDTRVEEALRSVLARGGVVGGTSAGASILGSFLVRGSPVAEGGIIYPGYTSGFGLLRETAVDQHVVARSRLRALPDTVLARYPGLLGIALDEGAALVVRGDTARAIGRSSVFISSATGSDSANSLLQLRPGDRFDLGARRIIRHARERFGFSFGAADSVLESMRFAEHANAAMLVTLRGEVLLAAAREDRVGGDSAERRELTPGTTALRLPLGVISDVIISTVLERAICEGIVSASERIGPSPTITMQEVLVDRTTFGKRRAEIVHAIVQRYSPGFSEFIQRRLLRPLGMSHTVVSKTTGEIHGTADDLFRFALALDDWRQASNTLQTGETTACDRMQPRHSAGWFPTRIAGHDARVAIERSIGRHHQFFNVPSAQLSIIVLSDDPAAQLDAVVRALAKRILNAD